MLNPWGDLIVMARAWCLVKPGGKALVGVPSGPGMNFKTFFVQIIVQYLCFITLVHSLEEVQFSAFSNILLIRHQV